MITEITELGGVHISLSVRTVLLDISKICISLVVNRGKTFSIVHQPGFFVVQGARFFLRNLQQDPFPAGFPTKDQCSFTNWRVCSVSV